MTIGKLYPFIRTRDNKIYVYEITEKYSNSSSIEVDRYKELGTNHRCAYGHMILKAENVRTHAAYINNLCDLYVIEYSDGSHEFTKSEEVAKRQNSITGTTVYGAIWTKAGLRFICVMLEGNEFCLYNEKKQF